MYSSRDITVSIHNNDNPFRILTEHVGEGNSNIVARGKYINPIERDIKTLKERVCCVVHYLSFRKHPAKNDGIFDLLC